MSFIDGGNTLANSNRLLWSLIGANMNSTADQAMTAAFPFATFIIDRIIVTNASTSLTLAAGGVYTSASKGGTAVVAAGQVYSALTSTAPTLALTLANTDVRSNTSFFLSLTTGQGATATADLRVFGWALS